MNGHIAAEDDDAKMAPVLEDESEENEENVSEEEEGDEDYDDDDDDDEEGDDDDDDDDDDDEEEEEASSSKKKKAKAKEPKKKEKAKTKTKANVKAKSTEKESNDQKRKKQVKGKDAAAEEKKKKKPSAPSGTTGHRKPHRFKPGVSAKRLAYKLFMDQAKHPDKAEFMGQSEPFVRLVDRLLGRSGGVNEEKKAVRMTRSSVQALREIYERNVEVLVMAAGDLCRLMGQTTLNVHHLRSAVALFQRHRHLTSLASFVTLPELKPASELKNVLESLGGTYDEVKRKTSRVMDERTRIMSRIRHALSTKSDDVLRIMAGHLNPNDQGSRRTWFETALARLVYVGTTSASTAIDIEAAKAQLEANKGANPKPSSSSTVAVAAAAIPSA